MALPPGQTGGSRPQRPRRPRRPGDNVWEQTPGPKPKPFPAPGGPRGPGARPWTSTQQSAYEMMAQQLKNWGLEALAGDVKSMVAEGITDSATIELRLQDTAAWRQRFAGNEMLRNAGLPVLSVGEYLSTERSYAQVMKQYGLPAGFYDDPSDFSQFIGNSVAPAEVQTRVQMYADLANREDPATRAQLQSMGMSQGDLLAYMIDPARAQPLIQNKYQTALIGSAARRAGVTADNTYVSTLASRGVTEQQAAEGYGLISGSLKDAGLLAGVSGESYGLGDMQAEVFDNGGAAGKKRKRLASQERARFGGSQGTAAGALRQSGSGSY